MFTIAEQIYNTTKSHTDSLILFDIETKLSVPCELAPGIIFLQTLFAIWTAFGPVVPYTILEHFGYCRMNAVMWAKLNDKISKNYYFGWVAKFDSDANTIATDFLKIFTCMVTSLYWSKVLFDCRLDVTWSYTAYQHEHGAISIIICSALAFFLCRKLVQFCVDIHKFAYAAIFNVVCFLYATICVRSLHWEINTMPLLLGRMQRDIMLEFTLLVLFVAWMIVSVASALYYTVAYCSREIPTIELEDTKKKQ